MKRAIIRSLLVVVVIGLAVAATAQQQPPAKAPAYDPSQEVTVSGTVTEMKDYVCPVSGTVGTHIYLKSGDGTVTEAHVASAKFLPEYGINLAVGYELEITGMKTKVADKDALLVRIIKHGNQIYTFRDRKGRPLW